MSGPRALIGLRHEPHGTPLKFEEPVMQLSEDAFKTKGSVEASVAKEPRRETVAKSE